MAGCPEIVIKALHACFLQPDLLIRKMPHEEICCECLHQRLLRLYKLQMQWTARADESELLDLSPACARSICNGFQMKRCPNVFHMQLLQAKNLCLDYFQFCDLMETNIFTNRGL